MTGIERLRALANGDASHEIGNGWFLTAETFESIADQIEREIEEAVADEVADTLSAYEMNTNARWYSAVEDGADSDCKAEYELISRYWLPRPRFEDGEPVQLGEEYTEAGEDGRVEHIEYSYIDGNVECMVWGSGSPISFGSWGPLKRPEMLTHNRPEPPDTWERIEADVKKGPCVYYGRAPFDCTDEDGGECRAINTDDCNECMVIEIVRRCKALAGVEWNGTWGRGREPQPRQGVHGPGRLRLGRGHGGRNLVERRVQPVRVPHGRRPNTREVPVVRRKGGGPMKCPLMFGDNDVFCNGRECIGTACMWRIEATDHNGNKTKSCAVPMMVARPGLSIGVQLSDKPDENGVD